MKDDEKRRTAEVAAELADAMMASLSEFIAKRPDDGLNDIALVFSALQIALCATMDCYAMDVQELERFLATTRMSYSRLRQSIPHDHTPTAASKLLKTDSQLTCRVCGAEYGDPNAMVN